MMPIFKAFVFGVVCFLAGTSHENSLVTGFRTMASRKAIPTTAMRLVLQEKIHSARPQHLTFQMSVGDETPDNDATFAEGDDLVDVVTTSFADETAAAQDEDEVNPLVAAAVILAGLGFSFGLLYFELQQAQFLN